MPIVIPTLKQSATANLERFESKLNQLSPLNDKSFLRTLSVNEAGIQTSLYKYAAERAKQNLTASATGSELDRIGNSYGVPRKLAQSAVITFTLPGINGTIIPATTVFVGDSNGAEYIPNAEGLISGGIATIQATAKTPGESGNLNVDNTLTISDQVAGAETVATVISSDVVGIEDETNDDYRVRIQDVERSEPGGSNSAACRIWAQEAAGVARAYPYSGRPVDDLSAGPATRTIYIEATTAIDPDGIAPQSVLDAARATITTDPETGLSRQSLGQTDDTLYVQSIIRTAIHIEIRNFESDPTQEASIKADILTSLTNYFLGLNPFIDGLDPDFDRNDEMTDLTISAEVQDVLSANSASSTGVGFGLTIGAFLPSYILAPGEKVKLGTITYA